MVERSQDDVVWHEAEPATDLKHHTLKILTIQAKKYDVSVEALLAVTITLTVILPLLILFHKRNNKAKRQAELKRRIIEFASQEEANYLQEDLKHLNTTEGKNLAKNVCYGCFEEEEEGNSQGLVALPNFRDIAVKHDAKTLCALNKSQDDILVGHMAKLVGKETYATDSIANSSGKSFKLRSNVLFRVSNPHRYTRNIFARIMAHLRRRFMSLAAGTKDEDDTSNSFAVPCSVLCVDFRHSSEKKLDHQVSIRPINDNNFTGSSEEVEVDVKCFPLMPSPFKISDRPITLFFYLLLKACSSGKKEAKQIATDQACEWMQNAGGLRGMYCFFLEFFKKELFDALVRVVVAIERADGEKGELIRDGMINKDHINLMILFHCSAGKDRTGLFAMLILTICGVDESEIIDSYGQSCSHFDPGKNPSVHMAHALRTLDEKTTRKILLGGSPPTCLRTALRYVEKYYGNIFKYLDSIGFVCSWRERLRRRMLVGYGV